MKRISLSQYVDHSDYKRFTLVLKRIIDGSAKNKYSIIFFWGDSSSGKSTVFQAIRKIIPEAKTINITCLEHCDASSFKSPVVFARGEWSSNNCKDANKSLQLLHKKINEGITIRGSGPCIGNLITGFTVPAERIENPGVLIVCMTNPPPFFERRTTRYPTAFHFTNTFQHCPNNYDEIIDRCVQKIKML